MIDTIEIDVYSDMGRANPQDRDASWYGTVGMVAACLGLLTALLFFSGCSGPARRNPSTHRRPASRSRSPWTTGKTVTTPSRSSRPRTPMTAQDFEWNSGAKLLDYEILGDGKEIDVNLHVQVKLKLEPTGQGQGCREDGLVRGRHQSGGDRVPRRQAALSRMTGRVGRSPMPAA